MNESRIPSIHSFGAREALSRSCESIVGRESPQCARPHAGARASWPSRMKLGKVPPLFAQRAAVMSCHSPAAIDGMVWTQETGPRFAKKQTRPGSTSPPSTMGYQVWRACSTRWAPQASEPVTWSVSWQLQNPLSEVPVNEVAGQPGSPASPGAPRQRRRPQGTRRATTKRARARRSKLPPPSELPAPRARQPDGFAPESSIEKKSTEIIDILALVGRVFAQEAICADNRLDLRFAWKKAGVRWRVCR